MTILLQTSFLFFITTTLVSFTLRETQEHMLEFTHQLSRLVSSRQPLQGLVTTHVLHNLIFVPIMVGMMFFLIEFYKGDKFLAFLVMTIVWICEVFSVIRYVSFFVGCMACPWKLSDTCMYIIYSLFLTPIYFFF
jgi:hypothetical protein